MNRHFVSIVAIACVAASSIPGVAAAGLSWDICTVNEKGKKICKSRIPHSARVAIAIGCLVVLLLIGALVVCIIRNRRAAVVAEEEYNVEASQVDGPATIVDTAYHPRSGPSAVYSGGKASPEMTGPSFPVAAQLPQYPNDASRTYTAPVYQVQFSKPPPAYPYTGYGPNNYGPSAPRTAFGVDFPRPLLTGDRLKERLKERPASASALVVSPRT